jgi:endonuclease III
MTKDDIIKTDRDKGELEAFLIFSICVAGKTANTIHPRVKKLMEILRVCKTCSPFMRIRDYVTRWGVSQFCDMLRDLGIGCYKMKGRAIADVARRRWDLRKVSIETLQTVRGIGPKTARFFVLHSRDEPCGVLDRHILRFMREECGVEGVPKETPSSGPTYDRLEQTFLRIYHDHYATLYDTVADFDFAVWESYAKHKDARAVRR